MGAAPVDDSWVAAIHRSANDFTPIGAGVVIDEHWVLTCAHVVPRGGTDMWVAFPKAGDPMDRRRVVSVTMPEAWQIADVALLELETEVPVTVRAAPLRCPRPADLAELGWWAYGFPRGDPLGNAAHGRIGASLGYGWVRLDADSRYLVEPGFSGGGLWSPKYGAVIALVGQANDRGDGRALSIHQTDLFLPGLGLGVLAAWSAETAGEVALAAWGWTLSADVEAKRHWLPRSRGVAVDSEHGHRFRGRTAALSELVGWLDRVEPDRRVLMVTGSPGVGKSAVLGRIVATADTKLRMLLPDGDDAVRATAGSVACAVHAKGKTALEVATEIARAASAALPQLVEDLPVVIQDALADHDGRRFNVIIDALDEAADPAETRMIINNVALPLAETCAAVGVQVVVGTRRRDNGGDLMAAFGAGATIIDLDDQRYFAQEDLTAYVLETLRLSGDERPGNPYSDDAVAAPVARRISDLADRNFLVAGLVARTHGLHDELPVDASTLSFTPTVRAALQAHIRRLDEHSSLSATAALTALAFAEAPGMPIQVWQVAIEALGGVQPTPTALSQFARSSAASFLIETGTGTPVFRLFHQALNDALLAARAEFVPSEQDQRALASMMLAAGKQAGWAHAPAYLLRSLPMHAARGETIDALLAEDEYPLHADLRRLLRHVDHAATADGQRRAQLLRHTRQAFDDEPAARAAMFGVTEMLDNLGHTYTRGNWQSPYRAAWAHVRARAEHTVFYAHPSWVYGMCVFTAGEETLIATAGDYGQVGVWDPITGEPRWVATCHDRAFAAGGLEFRWIVHGVCAYTVDGSIYLASAGHDATLRISDSVTGETLGVLDGHDGPVNAVCAFTSGENTYLASAGDDATVQTWCVTADESNFTLNGHEGPVHALCAFSVQDETYLASAGDDAAVWIWNFASHQTWQLVSGQEGSVHALCSFTLDNNTYLASAGDDATVRIWNLASGLGSHEAVSVADGPVCAMHAFTVHGQTYVAVVSDVRDMPSRITIWEPATGAIHHSFEHPNLATAIHALTLGGHAFLTTGGSDGAVRIWDPFDSAPQPSDPGRRDAGINAMCALTSAGCSLVATTSYDGTLQVWDAAMGELLHRLPGRAGRVSDVCTFSLSGRTLLATSGHGETVHISDPSTGELKSVLTVPGDAQGVCPLTLGGDSLLVTAGGDGALRIWDPVNGELRQTGNVHTDAVYRPRVVAVRDRSLIAAMDGERNVRLWDPATDEVIQFPTGHPNIVTMCTITLDGDAFIVTGGWDAEIRMWDPLTGELLRTLRGHDGRVHEICTPTVGARTLLATASDDQTVRIWDPDIGSCLLIIPVHHRAYTIAADGARLFIGLGEGLICIVLDVGILPG